MPIQMCRLEIKPKSREDRLYGWLDYQDMSHTCPDFGCMSCVLVINQPFQNILESNFSNGFPPPFLQ
jgi:hypothetical protein